MLCNAVSYIPELALNQYTPRNGCVGHILLPRSVNSEEFPDQVGYMNDWVLNLHFHKHHQSVSKTPKRNDKLGQRKRRDKKGFGRELLLTECLAATRNIIWLCQKYLQIRLNRISSNASKSCHILPNPTIRLPDQILDCSCARSEPKMCHK